MNVVQRMPLLFVGSSHPFLGKSVSELCPISLGAMELGHFPDGETAVCLREQVYGCDTFVLQSIAHSPDLYLVELLLIIDALKRGSARSVTAIVPYFGYCRQDRKDKPGVPIAAKLVANLLMTAGADRLITMDLHAGQLEGFFEIPVDHLHGHVLLADAVRAELSTPLVVAPDIGSVKIAERMAKELGVDFVVARKERLTPAKTRVHLIGNVALADVLLVDDICSTADTLATAALCCLEQGARSVAAAVIHGVFSCGAIDKISRSGIRWLAVTDSVPFQGESAHLLRSVSVASLIAGAVRELIAGNRD